MLYLAADHAGFKLKETIKEFLDLLEVDYEDYCAQKEDTDDDYPDYVKKVVKKMTKKTDRAVLVCGSGIGMCIAANRYKGIRAVVGAHEHAVNLGRTDEDINVLCLGGWLTNENMAKRFIKIFLNKPFGGETRHKRRITKLDNK